MSHFGFICSKEKTLPDRGRLRKSSWKREEVLEENGIKNRNPMRSSLVHILSAYPGCWLGRKEWLPNDGENAQRNEAEVSVQPLFKSTVKFLPTAS